MNIKCLLGRHDWRFSYHHSMPLGTNIEDALKMLGDGTSFTVDACERCRTQSRLINGKRVMLNRGEKEAP